MSDRDDALAAIDDFEKSGRSGIWNGISKSIVIKELRIRVANPLRVNQGGSLLCGPAAFAYELATDRPVIYVTAVINLFCSGSATIGTLFVKPSRDLINSQFKGGINPVDWIMLASLRDSENAFFDIEDVDAMAAAPTIPSTMVKWLQNVGFTKIVNETNLLFSKGKDNIESANSYFNSQYRVFLFINSFLLYTTKQTNDSLAPDHWVMMNTPVLFDGEGLRQTVSFYAYSWGEDRKIPESPSKPLQLLDFLKNYYGFVAFKH